MQTFLIGVYTQGDPSRGVRRLRVQGDALVDEGCVLPVEDPSYLMHGADGALWGVSEGLGAPEGHLWRAQRQGSGYARTALWPTQGNSPCHLAQSPGGRWLAVANYGSGSVAVFDGLKPESHACALFTGTLHGPDADRQEGPHAHFVSFRSEQELLCCDLGGDVLRHFYEARGVWSETAPLVAFAPGSGPRHLVLRGSLAYVACELSATLAVCDLATGRVLHSQPCVPNGAPGTAAAIRLTPEGHLMVSHRGADCISVLSLANPERPSLLGTWACGGAGPRDVWPLVGGALCACQSGNCVTLLRGDAAHGYLQVAATAVAAPVCILAETPLP